jgi:hypothetical protein
VSGQDGGRSFQADVGRAARAVTWLPALKLCNGGEPAGQLAAIRIWL